MTFSPCSDLYFIQPVLSGHLAIPRGWPLNTGSTVSSFWSYNFKWWKTKDNLRVDYSGFVWDSRCTPFVSTQPGCFLVRLWYSTLEPGQWDEVEPWPLNLQNCLVWLSCLMTNDYLTTLKNKINKNYGYDVFVVLLEVVWWQGLGTRGLTANLFSLVLSLTSP